MYGYGILPILPALCGIIVAPIVSCYLERKRDHKHINRSARQHLKDHTVFIIPERGDLVDVEPNEDAAGYLACACFYVYSDNLGFYLMGRSGYPVTFEILDIDDYCVSMREVGRRKIIQCALNSEYASTNRFMSAANKAWRLEKLTYAALT